MSGRLRQVLLSRDIVSVYFRYQSLGYLSRTLYCRQSERGLETLTGYLVLYSRVYSFRGVGRGVPNDIVSVYFRYQSLGYLSRTLYCRQNERGLETLTGSLVLYSRVYSFRGVGRGVPNDIVSVYFRYQSLGYLSRTLYCRQNERGLESLTGFLILYSRVYSFRRFGWGVPNDIVSVYFRYQSLGYLSRTLYCRLSERGLETLTGSLILYSRVYSFRGVGRGVPNNIVLYISDTKALATFQERFIVVRTREG